MLTSSRILTFDATFSRVNSHLLFTTGVTTCLSREQNGRAAIKYVQPTWAKPKCSCCESTLSKKETPKKLEKDEKPAHAIRPFDRYLLAVTSPARRGRIDRASPRARDQSRFDFRSLIQTRRYVASRFKSLVHRYVFHRDDAIDFKMDLSQATWTEQPREIQM